MKLRKKLFNKRKNSPTKQANGTASIPTKTEETTQSDTRLEANTPTYTTWSVQNFSYGNFLDILLKKKMPIEFKMAEDNWKDILTEYCSLIVTKKSQNIFDVYQRWFYTNWKIETVDRLLTFLKVAHDADIAIALQELGYDLIEYKEDRTEYLKQIYLIESEAKTLIVLLNQYAKEYQMLTDEIEDNGIVRDEMHYQKEIAIMQRHMGQRIKKYKISVFEWAAYVNAYVEYHKLNQEEKQNDGESI
jgi:hypothetical protein